MAHYLVTAKPKENHLDDLADRLRENAYVSMRPFGKVMTFSLENARIREDGYAVWEEEDYCTPPLAQERAAAIDEFFEDIRVDAVEKGEGWSQISYLPKLFPKIGE